MRCLDRNWLILIKIIVAACDLPGAKFLFSLPFSKHGYNNTHTQNDRHTHTHNNIPKHKRKNTHAFTYPPYLEQIFGRIFYLHHSISRLTTRNCLLTRLTRARIYPKMTKKFMKKIENPELRGRRRPDSKMDVEHDAQIYFSPSSRVLIFDFLGHFQGPKPVLGTGWVKGSECRVVVDQNCKRRELLRTFWSFKSKVDKALTS